MLFSREGAEDRLYATDRSGVGPEEGFSHKLSRKDEAMRYGRNGSWAPVGGKILDSSNAARKLHLRSVIRTLYIKLIIINCLSTGQGASYSICLTFERQLISFSSPVALSRLTSLIKIIFMYKAEANK